MVSCLVHSMGYMRWRQEWEQNRATARVALFCYNTTDRPARPVYCRGDPCGRPVSLRRPGDLPHVAPTMMVNVLFALFPCAALVTCPTLLPRPATGGGLLSLSRPCRVLIERRVLRIAVTQRPRQLTTILGTMPINEHMKVLINYLSA